jgi:hypothetical protein
LTKFLREVILIIYINARRLVDLIIELV